MTITVDDIMETLRTMGNEATKKVLLKHGVLEPFFGVKIEDMKTILKQTKKNHELSKALYATGNSDAMYLAGLMADETAMTKKDLETWASQAFSANIAEYTVPWITAETPFGEELAKVWIESPDVRLQGIGWSTYCNVVTLKKDEELDLGHITSLLKVAESNIQEAPNELKTRMNLFIISVGAYVNPLSQLAIETAHRIGKVIAKKDGTACKVPEAVTYIEKSIAKGSLSKKKKMARC